MTPSFPKWKISRQQIEAQRRSRDKRLWKSSDVTMEKSRLLMTREAFHVVLPRLALQTCHHWWYRFIEGWQPDQGMWHKRVNGRWHSSSFHLKFWPTPAVAPSLGVICYKEGSCWCWIDLQSPHQQPQKTSLLSEQQGSAFFINTISNCHISNSNYQVLWS